MKPTLPEDREIDAEAAEISRRYREAASEQPSPRIDAAILDAARREAARPAVVRNWRAPAAVAAVLVIGVSVSLLIREEVESLPPLDQSHSQAELARPDAPGLAMKAEPAPKGKVDMQSRPSRDRAERGAREAEARHGEEPLVGRLGTPQTPVPVPDPVRQFDAPAAPAPAPDTGGGAKNSTIESTVARNSGAEQSGVADVLNENVPARASEQKQPEAEKKAHADGAQEKRAKSQSKPESSAPPVSAVVRRSPEQWLRDIEGMIGNGRQADARLQLAEFRKRYPDYRLPDVLQAFEREATPDPQ